MANFGENDRFRSQMFESGNKLGFERRVDEASRQWWLKKFYDTFELTPESMADRITRSAPGEKSTVYHFIDGARESFSLRIDGDFPGTQEFWFAHQELDLKGSAFNAEGMDITEAMQGGGYGRALMGDLIDTGRLVGIDTIRLRAERVGRYVWVKMGFLPTEDAWRTMKAEAYDFILSHMEALGRANAMGLLERVHKGSPDMARVLASIDIPVPSSHLPSRFTPKPMPFAKVFFLEAASPWSGSLDLRDEEAMKVVESYRKSK
jgi:GNAT superfamily N-acetyltransferase